MRRTPEIDDIISRQHLLDTKPRRYLFLCHKAIQERPHDPLGYFDRHSAWIELGRFDLALADLDRTIELEERDATPRDSLAVSYRVRGTLHSRMGEYRKAIEDFDRSEATSPEHWADCLGTMFRAGCHARLGNEAAALADCARLADDHWTPGPLGAPAGTKEEVIAEVKRLAAEARNSRPQ